MRNEIKKYWKQLENGTKLMFKEFFNKDTNKKQRANMWTFSRLVISFLIPIFSIISIITGTPALFLFSIFITGFGAITDFFDGRSARKYNSYSEYGQFLDQLADKVFSIMIGINLSLFNPLYILELLGEGIISITNILYKIKYKDISIKSTQIGRIKQWPLFTSLILGFISTLTPSLTIVTNITIILTILLQITTALSYVKNNEKLVENIQKIKFNEFVKFDNELENKNKNEKIKVIENKNNKNLSKAKLYEELKNLRSELNILNEPSTYLDESSYQKTKYY